MQVLVELVPWNYQKQKGGGAGYVSMLNNKSLMIIFQTPE